MPCTQAVDQEKGGTSAAPKLTIYYGDLSKSSPAPSGVPPRQRGRS